MVRITDGYLMIGLLGCLRKNNRSIVRCFLPLTHGGDIMKIRLMRKIFILWKVSTFGNRTEFPSFHWSNSGRKLRMGKSLIISSFGDIIRRRKSVNPV